jgi:hypothetical protein
VAVIQRGTDTSGRPIRATAAMWAAWDAACAVLGFEPTIVQGGFMGASSATASATTHLGDALDIRLWDRTAPERAEMIRVFRRHGLAYWERYESQGFDLHAHMIPGPWASPSAGALDQWHDYLNGRNGLASNGPDYHWRPSPPVTEPPEADDMPYTEKELRAIIADEVAKSETRVVGRIEELERGTLSVVRKLFANIRVVLKERFGSTDAELDDIIGHLEP